MNIQASLLPVASNSSSSDETVLPGVIEKVGDSLQGKYKAGQKVGLSILKPKVFHCVTVTIFLAISHANDSST